MSTYDALIGIIVILTVVCGVFGLLGWLGERRERESLRNLPTPDKSTVDPQTWKAWRRH